MRTLPVKPQPAVPRRRSRERGMSVVEALVAIFIFSIAFLTAMMLYQTANRTYLRTDAAAVQQQNIRFALDRVSETLRDAGAGHNMLGSGRLADEQIEGAWQAAVFVRGDFDGSRENELETGDYPIVTTGNDEIVGYVLRKEKESDNGKTINIIADFSPDTGRDAVWTSNSSISGEETVAVKVAALTLDDQDTPPYRLERVTFSKTSPVTPKYELVADNIFRLTFRYMEDDVTIEPINLTTGAGTGSANTERDERARIRRIEVNLMGMTERPDLGYRDEADYSPQNFLEPLNTQLKGHRKFAVSQTIFAANLGIVGGEHNLTPALDLDAPTYITACAGHCRRYLISWPASPSAGVTKYSLRVTAPAQDSVAAYEQSFTVTGLSYQFHEPDADVEANIFREFTFQVAPMSGDNIGEYTSAVARMSDNDQSTPEVVTNVTAAPALGANALLVTWDDVANNANTVTDNTCISAGSMVGPSPPDAPWNNQAVDLKASRVYRVRSTGTNNGSDVTDDVTELELGELKNVALSNAFTDNTAAPCSAYFYRVKACDLCDVTSEDFSAPMAEPVKFDLESGIVPAKPDKPTPVGSVGFDGTNYTVTLQWTPVTRTSEDTQAAVAHYVLERWRRLGTTGSYTLEKTSETTGPLYEVLQAPLDSAPAVVSGQNAYYRYYLKAVYDCTVPRVSPESEPFELACLAPATNTMAFVQPPAGDIVYRPGETLVPISVATTGSGWTSATLTITNSGGDVVYGPVGGIAGTNSYSFGNWNVSDTEQFEDGDYTLSVSGMVGACTTPAPVTRTIELATVSCGQRIVNATFTGNGSNFAETMTFRIENSCPYPVSFNSMTPSWTGVLATVRVRRLTLGASQHYNNAVGIVSGGTMPFSAPVTLSAAPDTETPTTSGTFTFTFSDNFTINGNQNGTTGKFGSILISITDPEPSSEQLIETPVP